MPEQVGDAIRTERPLGPVNSAMARPRTAGETIDHKMVRDEASSRLGDSGGLSREEIDKITGELNSAIEVINTRVAFEIEDGSGRVVIKVVDNVTGEVLRQIPPAQLLEVMQKLTDLVGLLVDERK